ncbi:MAG: hypothetical protein Q3962_01270 [Corynebacterium sp.]|nr:hypothetical protein [Corynebacterium sp.]
MTLPSLFTVTALVATLVFGPHGATESTPAQTNYKVVTVDGVEKIEKVSDEEATQSSTSTSTTPQNSTASTAQPTSIAASSIQVVNDEAEFEATEPSSSCCPPSDLS